MRSTRPRTRLNAVALFALVAGLMSCSTDVTQPEDDVRIATVELTVLPDTLTALGETVQLTAVALDADGNEIGNVDLQWTSSDGGVVEVDTDGLVTALDNGEATITVAASKDGSTQTATTPVAVVQHVDAVVVTPDASTLAAGASVQFAAAAADANGNAVSDVAFLWVSSDHNVATIDQTGLATGVGSGTVTITAVGGGEPGSTELSVTGEITPEVTQVVFSVQPGDARAGTPLDPAIEVELRDAAGAVVRGAREAVTLTIATDAADEGSATLIGTTTLNAIDGIASFSGISLDKAGSGYTLSASSGVATSGTSAEFSVTHAAPSRLAFTVQPSDVEGNTPIARAIEVVVLDEYGNRVEDASEPITLDMHTNPLAATSDIAGRLDGTLTASPRRGVATFDDVSIDSPAMGYRLAARSAGTEQAVSDPVAVSLTIEAVSMNSSLGSSHACGLAPSGAYCWGSNTDGQLGAGARSTREPVPVLVRGGLDFASIHSGSLSSCGLTTSGAAYCWGSDALGVLGNGGPDFAALTPVPVAGGHVFDDLVVGRLHACGILVTSGAAMCWGYNSGGAIGDGTEVTRRTPVAVLGGIAFRELSVGRTHTCGLSTSGDAYCWGSDSRGQLGIAATSTPQLEPILVDGGRTYGSISAGYEHTCAVTTAGDGYCWGENAEGQIGDGTAVRAVSPTEVFGGLSWQSLAAGWEHTCGLTVDGAAYCWGRNNAGQLGDGQSPTDALVRSAVAGGLTFRVLEAGASTNCGLTAKDELYCWGSAGDGLFGNGARSNSDVPVPGGTGG